MGSQNDITPNWELTVSLLQSLRRLRSHWSSPRPAVALVDNSVNAVVAGPQALTANEMQEAEHKLALSLLVYSSVVCCFVGKACLKH